MPGMIANPRQVKKDEAVHVWRTARFRGFFTRNNVTTMSKNRGGKQRITKVVSGTHKQINADEPVFSRSDSSVVIRVLAKPGAKENSITGFTTEGVGVQISAPPVKGEANAELIKYLAKVLGIRKSDIQLDQGAKSHNKIVSLDKSCGLTLETVIDKLRAEAKS